MLQRDASDGVAQPALHTGFIRPSQRRAGGYLDAMYFHPFDMPGSSLLGSLALLGGVGASRRLGAWLGGRDISTAP